MFSLLQVKLVIRISFGGFDIAGKWLKVGVADSRLQIRSPTDGCHSIRIYVSVIKEEIVYYFIFLPCNWHFPNGKKSDFELTLQRTLFRCLFLSFSAGLLKKWFSWYSHTLDQLDEAATLLPPFVLPCSIKTRTWKGDTKEGGCLYTILVVQ